MKKLLLFLTIGLFTLVGCMKETNLYVPPQPTQNTGKTDNTVSAADIEENLRKVFGVAFDANQDWSCTSKNSVTITANADMDDIVKVQILTQSPFGSGDGNGCIVLNEAEVKQGEKVELNYDAPSYCERLYAACVSKKGMYYIKSFAIGEESVSFGTLNSRMTRASSNPIFSMVDALPQNPVLGELVTSYAKERNYPGFENDRLYTMTNEAEAAQMLHIEAYNFDAASKKDMNDIIFTYLPNKVSNIEKIRGCPYYNESSYPLTTGDDPIIVEPIYKDDGGYDEVEYCHLYYYYFKDSDLEGKTEEEQVQFFKDLPKYRAFYLYPVVHYGGQDKGMTNKVLDKKMAFALIYWGEGEPVLGETVGSYHFPQGMRIGFMLRNSDKHVEHHGELYGDGRLNKEVNKWGHLASSKLGDTDARMAWLTANNRMLLCCESGTDRDFNDLVLEIEGGVEPLVVVPTVEEASYTYCYEDTQLGDYDLNDVVIKAKRKNKTTVEYSIVACGAHDSLYVRNINVGAIKDDVEVHSLFNVGTNQFINTVSGETIFTPVTVVKTVDKTFSFTDPETQPYIYNKTKNLTVRISKKGEDPHGIMVPLDFSYPIEKICVKDAYYQFNQWGQNSSNSIDWYKNPTDDKAYGQ